MESPHDREVPLSFERGSLSKQTVPCSPRVAALQQDDTHVRCELEQPQDGGYAGVDLCGLRGAIDVPGVCVPRQKNSRGKADHLEKVGLKFRGAVVVLGADKSAARVVLRCRAGVAEDAENLRIRAAVEWRDVGNPAATLLAQLVDVLIDRGDMRRVPIRPRGLPPNSETSQN